ncbi:type II secretion system F family protein [Chloroflexota bacterium]
MMKYIYTVYTNDKKIKRGTINADSLKTAERDLLKSGIQRVLNLEEFRSKYSFNRKIGLTLFAVSNADVLEFSRECANLVGAGISIITALELLAKETARNSMRAVIINIVSDLRAGKSLSQAMSKHPKVFSTTYLAIMRTSEQTGEIASGLNNMTEHIEKQENIKKRIRRALTYPVMVIFIAIGVSALLITAVLPPIVDMFDAIGTDLPMVTKLFVTVTSFIIAYKIYLLAAFISLPFMLIGYISLPSGRYNIDKLVLIVPQIGQIVLRNNLLFFCRAAAILLHAGVSISTVLATCSVTVGNSRIRAAIAEGERELLKGAPFSRAMEKTRLFSASSIQSIVVGEGTGELESTLENLARYFERTSQEKIDNLISLIEPAFTIGIGLVVGLLAISVIAPIYSLSGGLP